MSTYQHRVGQTRVFLAVPAPGGWAARLRAMWQARQTRRILGQMDDRQLADIGIGRGDALIEAARPMWALRDTLR